MSERQPVVLLIAREGVMHRALGALLADDCALLGARTAGAVRQIARQRPPDVVLLDESFEDLDSIVTTLRESVEGLRLVILATPALHGHKLRRLATFGPVVEKPIDYERLRTLVLNTARLSALAPERDGGAADGTTARFRTTKVQRGQKPSAPR